MSWFKMRTLLAFIETFDKAWWKEFISFYKKKRNKGDLENQQFANPFDFDIQLVIKR